MDSSDTRYLDYKTRDWKYTQPLQKNYIDSFVVLVVRTKATQKCLPSTTTDFPKKEQKYI